MVALWLMLSLSIAPTTLKGPEGRVMCKLPPPPADLKCPKNKEPVGTPLVPSVPRPDDWCTVVWGCKPKAK